MILANQSNSLAPQFRLLNEAQRQELFLAALECMDRVGVLVMNAEARTLLETAGARIDGQTAHIPEQLVRQALQTARREFSLWGRSGQKPVHIGPGRVHLGPGPTCTYFIDPETGERRKARRGDAALTARVCDALPHFDYVMGLSLFDDVTPVLSPVYEFAESIASTEKPVVAWVNNEENFVDILSIAAAVAGGEEALRRRPSFGLFATYESPLRLAENPMGGLLRAVEAGIPAILLGGPTVGLESPFSGASALTLYLATALSGLTILQLKRPGAAVMIGAVPSPMDLRTVRPSYGSPESMLHTAGCAELANWLKLPFMGTGGATESKQLDAQAGIEASLQILMSTFTQADLVHDIGFLDCADIGSLAYLVLVDEIAAMVARLMRGIPVSRETIMLDLIEQVGPGGTYLTEPRSVSLCRAETWMPSLLDRQPFPLWEQKGSLATADRADAKLRKILQDHHPDPLPQAVGRELEAILAAAEARQ